MFDNIKVAAKLLLIVAVAAVAMIVISFVGYRSLTNADEAMESMYNREMQGGSALRQSGGAEPHYDGQNPADCNAQG